MTTVQQRKEKYRLSAETIGRISDVCSQALREAENSDFIFEKLIAQAGTALVYTYKNGENCLSIHPPKKTGSPREPSCCWR